MLLAKAVLDFVLVVWLAVSFYFAAFVPVGEGRIEKIDGELRGRFVASRQERGGEVQLFVDGVYFGASRVSCGAEEMKPDARRAAGCEFSFALPPLAAGDHEAAAYVSGADVGEARRSLRIIGEPVRFRIESSETVRADAIRR